MRRFVACGVLCLVLLVAAGPVRSAPGEATAGILVSRQLARARGLAVGDVVSLSPRRSGAEARAFRVVGIYEPTPDPMRINQPRLDVRLHLPDLLRLTADPADPLAPETVSAINVLLRPGEDARAFAVDTNRRSPFVMAAPVASDDALSNPFVVLERFHLAIALITVLGGSAFVLALMVMRADERRETVGILRLIGLSRSRVLLEVFVEGLLVALAGALFGLALAAGGQGLFNRFFQWRYDTPLVFMRVTLPIAWRCIALAVPLGVLAGVVASWTLLRREILALLRR